MYPSHFGNFRIWPENTSNENIVAPDARWLTVEKPARHDIGMPAAINAADILAGRRCRCSGKAIGCHGNMAERNRHGLERQKICHAVMADYSL